MKPPTKSWARQVLASEAYRKAYGLVLSDDQVPPIPSSFTQDRLQAARNEGQKLVLQAGDLSMLTANDAYKKAGNGSLLYSTDLYHKENFANDPLPRGWRLMSTKVLLGSTGKKMPPPDGACCPEA